MLLRLKLACAALVVLLVATPSNAINRQKIVGQASVIDGDTIEIHGQRIRLHGIDAPESRQLCDNAAGKPYRCGQKAALALSDKIGRRTVNCEPRDMDRYGRIVAVCRTGGVILNAWLVSEGLAVAFRRYSTDYVTQEASARRAKRGIGQGALQSRRNGDGRAETRSAANQGRATAASPISATKNDHRAGGSGTGDGTGGASAASNFVIHPVTSPPQS